MAALGLVFSVRRRFSQRRRLCRLIRVENDGSGSMRRPDGVLNLGLVGLIPSARFARLCDGVAPTLFGNFRLAPSQQQRPRFVTTAMRPRLGSAAAAQFDSVAAAASARTDNVMECR